MRAVRPTLAARGLRARAEAILEDARATSRAMRDESVAFGHHRHAVIDDAVARARKPHAWPYEAHRSTTALEPVSGESGVALVSASAVTPGFSEGIVVSPLPAPTILGPIGLLSPIGQKDTPVVAAFKAAVRLFA
ncbi:LysR substrate-binding domain-containing protein [Tropicimonas aquimaris]|uniref:LysR substrate-binding domain-containing protein n=1 Tax=Tropicimonas aquimaris TaxID=914152 RepID=A0ABW3IUV6_9RHOB